MKNKFITVFMQKRKPILESTSLILFLIFSSICGITNSTNNNLDNEILILEPNVIAGSSKIVNDAIVDSIASIETQQVYLVGECGIDTETPNSSENIPTEEYMNTTETVPFTISDTENIEMWASTELHILDKPDVTGNAIAVLDKNTKITLTGIVENTDYRRMTYNESDCFVNISELADSPNSNNTIKVETPIETTVETTTDSPQQEVTETQPEIVQEEQTETVDLNTPIYNGSVLNPYSGTNDGPSGKETYYNLPMNRIVQDMHARGFNYEYWVRDDGCKMLGDYIMVAANLSLRPKGTIVETSLGLGLVCDTGSFASKNPTQLDIATTW